MEEFDKSELEKLFVPDNNSQGEDNGQVTIIGGSKLFHGAPIFSLKAASRIIDMVFFASPEPSIGDVADKLKSQLSSFIWVPWNDVESYVAKSDAILIGPGFMRFSSESQTEESRQLCDAECQKTKDITKRLLTQFPDKKWVIDAGSLQVMDPSWIPENAILTPNKKEFEMLFGSEVGEILRLHPSVEASAQDDKVDRDILSAFSKIESVAKSHKCIIVLKGPETLVTNGNKTVIVKGGNAGLTKGGTGDTLAGLTVALLAKNEPFLAASSANYIVKKTADLLYEKVGTFYNSDDLSNLIPDVFHEQITK